MSDSVQDLHGMERKHLKSVDTTKGLIIIAVVLLHFIIIVPTSDERVGSSALPLQALYTGLMLFFIYSGYFFRPGKSAVEQIKKRLIITGTVAAAGLLILPVLMYLYTAALGLDSEPADIIECYRSLFGNWRIFQSLDPDAYIDYPLIAIHNGYYFLQIMLVSFVMFYPIAGCALGDDRRLIASIIALTAGTAVLAEFPGMELPLYAQLAPVSTAFMIFGAFLGKHRAIERIEYGGLASKLNLKLTLIAGIVGIIMLVVFPPGVAFDNTVFGDYGGLSVFPYFIICCCFCYIFLSIGVLLSMIPFLSRMLSVLGRHTLGILCLHVFTLKLLIAPGYGLVRGYAFPDFAVGEKILIGLAAIALLGLFLEYAVPFIFGRAGRLCSRK